MAFAQHPTNNFCNSPQFFTATRLEWKPLLHPGNGKDMIIGSLRFRVQNVNGGKGLQQLSDLLPVNTRIQPLQEIHCTAIPF